jgi:rubrerythrin
LKENNRAKLYRLSLSDELKKKSNELTKERMIRYRERIKEKQTGKPAKVSTQKEAKEEEDAKGRMRVYWRGKKRESRARESTDNLYSLALLFSFNLNSWICFECASFCIFLAYAVTLSSFSSCSRMLIFFLSPNFFPENRIIN